MVRSGRNSNSSKILCMSSLPASLKRIGSITTDKKWWRRFFRRSRAANCIVSGGIWPKFKSSKLLSISSLPASMKRIRSKTAEKMWWRSFPHYKSMGIFSNAQGQLTPLSVVRSGRISTSFIILCMSLLPASLKKIGSISTEITWWHRFFRRSRAANSVVSSGICPKFKLI